MTRHASATATTLLVIAKQPVPGRVKTRLVPPCTHEQAAALAEAALADTLDTVLMLPARRRVLVLDGRPGPWLPPGFDIVPQCGGPLDERLRGVEHLVVALFEGLSVDGSAPEAKMVVR